MTSFSDNFNRADSTDLGANWVEVSGDWSIVSNQLSPGNAGGTIILRCATAMATNDHTVQITIAATAAVSQGIWARGNSNITSGYLWRNNGTSWDLFSVVGGSFTSIGTFAAAASPGDIAKLQVQGTTITGYVNGVAKVTVTDTAVSTGTSVGVRGESTNSLRYDDFSAADLTGSVSGTATASLGGLTGAASGTPTVSGTAAGSLGALSGAASGVPTVRATASGSFGVLAGASSGTPTVVAGGAFSGGALTGGAGSVRTVVGSASGSLGGLVGAAGAPAHVNGTASGTFGALVATGYTNTQSSSSSSGSGGWYQMLSIKAEAVAWKVWELTNPPLACPYDGEPLRDTPRSQPGGKYCPLGDYRWPQQPRII